MDYTSIPRSLFYKEKTDLSIYTRKRADDSLEYQFFKKLKLFVKESIKAPEYAQKVLNNACYICSLIYHQDDSSIYSYRYLKIAECGFEDSSYRKELKAITMALVYNWLNTSWFKNEKAVLDGGIEEIEEIMEDIYGHYNMQNPFTEVDEWIKKVFFRCVFGFDPFSSNMRFSDISCRPICDAVEDRDVSIIDIVKGIDYICDSAFHEGDNELYILEQTYNRLKNEAVDCDELSAYQKEHAFEKVKSRLRELGSSLEEPSKDATTPIVANAVHNYYISNNNEAELEQLRKECDEWKRKYEEIETEYKKAQIEYKKAENERDMLKELFREKPGSKKFTSRQTAIVAYALCQKGGFIPKNKKNITALFHDLTGFSVNTLGQNLCTSYEDDEIEKVAKHVETDMPEFAQYLREKTFYLPEKTK